MKEQGVTQNLRGYLGMDWLWKINPGAFVKVKNRPGKVKRREHRDFQRTDQKLQAARKQ
jgi:hypothetical protein